MAEAPAFLKPPCIIGPGRRRFHASCPQLTRCRFLIDPLRVCRTVSCGPGVSSLPAFFPRFSDIAGHRHWVRIRAGGMPPLPATQVQRGESLHVFGGSLKAAFPATRASLAKVSPSGRPCMDDRRLCDPLFRFRDLGSGQSSRDAHDTEFPDVSATVASGPRRVTIKSILRGFHPGYRAGRHKAPRSA